MTFTWNNWEAVKCNAGETEMIVGVSAGPRILSISHRGGKNLLYIDHTDFRVGDWRMYGGHRFTIAPETEASYYPDNTPCEVTITDTALLVKGPQRKDGIRLSMNITAAETGGFNIQHILENNGSENWNGMLWAITCVPRIGDILASCTTAAINYWPGTAKENWQQTEQYLIPAAGNFRGKTGWYEERGWLAAMQASAKLIIHNKDHSRPGNNNLEIFVCKDYAELETLSPVQTIAPGASAQHLQHWYIFT